MCQCLQKLFIIPRNISLSRKEKNKYCVEFCGYKCFMNIADCIESKHIGTLTAAPFQEERTEASIDKDQNY